MWTKFMDMHSGGKAKLEWQYIFIELPQQEAEEFFERKFGRDPNNVTCNCCGPDYSIDENEDILQATGYFRGLRYAQKKDKKCFVTGKYLEPDEEVPVGWELGVSRTKGITLKEYFKQDSVKIIPTSTEMKQVLHSDEPWYVGSFDE